MKKIFLIAGEASGDFLGAGLMKSLQQGGSFSFHGVGGPQMIRGGLVSLFPYNELSLFGLVEILPHIFQLLRRIRQTIQTIEQLRPDVIVTIDSPGFNFRVLKGLQKRGISIPKIHYAAPQVWAWRPKRAQKLAHLMDHMLCLFPFEPEFFLKEGLAATFVGHPLAEMDVRPDSSFECANVSPVLTLLPGSRQSEVKRLLPIFQETCLLLKKRYPNLLLLIPTLPHLKLFVEKAFTDFPIPWRLLTPDEKIQGFIHSQAALAASGTVTLELARCNLPTVVAYRLSPLTYFYVKRCVKVDYASLVNILENRSVQPEFIQDNCTPKNLANAIAPLLEDSSQRLAQQMSYLDAIAKLRSIHGSPSTLAAQVVEGYI